MSRLMQALRFAAGLYAGRATTAYWGYVRRDPVALLQLAPGRYDPYPIYEQLRARGRMTPTRLGNWATTSHQVCDQVLRDRRLGVRPADVPGDAQDEQLDLSFLDRNPPEHTRLRRLAAPAFSPKRIAGYRPLIEKTVHRLLDDAEKQGRFDLVSAFAAPLPIAVITELLGVPDARADEFARYGAVIGSALDGIKSLDHAKQLTEADHALEQLFCDLFELRRHEPADDVISHVVAAEGDAIGAEEMLPLCVLLLIAGFETTVNLIGNGTMALLGHRDQWDALCLDPGLASQAVEETLRWDPPVQRTARVALEDVEVDGKPVRKDQFILTLLGAANRDPDVYAEPGRFDILRDSPTEHLAFSAGIHYCVGQPLARLEGAIAFEALAERMPSLQVVGPVKRRNASTIRGAWSLPVSA